PVNCRNLLIVVIDGTGMLASSEFQVEKFKSVVTQEFGDLVAFIKSAKIFTMGASKGRVPIPSTKGTATYVELQRSKVDPPANVLALFPAKDASGKVKSDTVKIKIKEKVHVSFRVGVSNALIDRKIFKIDNKQLVIKLDS